MNNDQKLSMLVIGMLIDSPAMFEQVEEILTENCFHGQDRKVFAAIRHLNSKGEIADLHSINKHLGGLKEVDILEYTKEWVSPVLLPQYSYKLREYNMAFECRKVASKIESEIQNNSDVFEVISNAEAELANIREITSISKCRSIDQILSDIRNTGETKNGITTGFHELDDLCNGWQNTNLYVIAARPGIGKTSWMLCSALAAANSGKRVMIFSIEMGERQLIERLKSIHSGIPHYKILKSMMTADERNRLEQTEMALASLPIFIDDSPVLYDVDLRGKVRSAKRKQGVDIVFLDYLQKMYSNERERERQVGSCAEWCKNTAKDINVPVIALTQLSRKTEEMPMKRPDLSCLRESGIIEQEADVVAFLYRKWYYHQLGFTGYDSMGFNYKSVNEQSSSEHYGEFIIAKNRHGRLEDYVYNFSGNTMKWSDL